MSAEAGNNTRVQADTPFDIANLFNQYFASVFTLNPMVNNEESYGRGQQSSSVIHDSPTITCNMVFQTLISLDVTKAQGPDGIPARILKETAEEIAPSLCALFNQSLKSGVVPHDWKLANIVPVFKSGEKSHVENYRPISLLGIISKVMERCVLALIKDQVYAVINNSQHGFTPRKSCTTQLLEVLDFIGKQLDCSGQVDIIYLDMAKAFDRVNYQILVGILHQCGLSADIVRWIQSYLTNRQQRVTVLSETSNSVQVTSGVPQGSILGPVLFLLYANSLPDHVSSSNLASFADDTKIFQTIRDPVDAIRLQSDLDNLTTWSYLYGIPFNTTKCEVQTMSRKKNPIVWPYSMNGNCLRNCHDSRDLGIWISSDLSWKKQVLTQCARANQILGYVKRSTVEIKNVSVRRTLYLTLVRSHLGYGTQVWTPQTSLLIKRLERVQRRATKFILNLPFRCSTTYQERLIESKLLPISYWHEFLDLVLLFKAINGLVDISYEVLPKPKLPCRQTRSSASSDEITLQQPFCRTKTYQTSYIIRATRVWNILPNDLRKKSNSLNSFKVKLWEYYVLAVSSCCDPENSRTWKSICMHCNKARSLHLPITCCF